MSDQSNENPDGRDDADSEHQQQQPSELDLLKARAKMLGVTHGNNISVETLREKIAAKLAGDEAAATKTDAGSPPEDGDKDLELPPAAGQNEPAAPAAKVKKLTLRQYMIQENMKLVRIRVTCLDPKKKEWKGEILTIANEYLGTVSKFVPFGEMTENGYHVPHCIYKMMKNRKFNSIRTFKDPKNPGQVKIEERWVHEFAIEVLDPLTPDELAKLAAAQTAAGNIG